MNLIEYITQPLNNHSRPVKWLFAAASFVLAPFADCIGLAKFAYYKFEKKQNYTTAFKHDIQSMSGDMYGKTYLFTAALTRASGPVALALTSLWLLGLIASIVLPVPGLAPLYAALTAKPLLVGAIAYFGPRIAAVTIGYPLDYMRIHSISEGKKDHPFAEAAILKNNGLWNMIKLSLFGEMGSLRYLFKESPRVQQNKRPPRIVPKLDPNSPSAPIQIKKPERKASRSSTLDGVMSLSKNAGISVISALSNKPSSLAEEEKLLQQQPVRISSVSPETKETGSVPNVRIKSP